MKPSKKPFSCGATTKAMIWAKRMRTTLYGTSGTSIKGSMTMKKIFAKTYFDYEKFARDLFMCDYWFDDGFVFRAA